MLNWTHVILAVLLSLSILDESETTCKIERTQVTCESISYISSVIVSSIPKISEAIRITIQLSPELEISPEAFQSAVKLQILVIDSKVSKVYYDSFKNLPVEYLSMSSCGVDFFPSGTFTTLKYLKILRLDDNNLETVPLGLGNLPLKELKLSNNRIQVIENNELENLSSLSQLKLDGNKLQTIYPHRILTHPDRLGLLFLHNNQLTTITNYMLQGLTKLMVLNLGGNLISFVEPNSFEQTPILNYLILSNNQIKVLNDNVLPRTGLSYLKALYLDDNRLMYLSRSVLVRLVGLRQISIAGNPWLCPCVAELEGLLRQMNVTEICSEDYDSGKRPFCVNKKNGSSECRSVYDDKLWKKYETFRNNDSLAKPPLSCVELK